MSDILQLKITLKGSKPPIWRRVWVEKDTALEELHYIIQTAMGWDSSHLWTFEVGNESFGPVDEDGMMGFEPGDVNDAAEEKLGARLGHEKAKFSYTYDMGDSWEHQILVEKVLPRLPGQQYPFCTDGKLNCPPEDCGGIWGFYALLEALKDPNHPEHEDMTEWIGDDYDPLEFDLEEVNRQLKARA